MLKSHGLKVEITWGNHKKGEREIGLTGFFDWKGFLRFLGGKVCRDSKGRLLGRKKRRSLLGSFLKRRASERKGPKRKLSVTRIISSKRATGKIRGGRKNHFRAASQVVSSVKSQGGTGKEEGENAAELVPPPIQAV